MQPNKSIIIVLLGLLTVVAYSQNPSITGKVIDESGEPVSFANVILLDANDSIQQGVVTSETGLYVFESVGQERYKIKVSYIGFQEYVTSEFVYNSAITLEDIVLKVDAALLDEVTVTAKKPQITRKADRLVFNVENTILSTSNTWDILNRTPGVVIKQDELTVRNQGVTVYLNDRKVELSSAELKSLLEGMGGEAVSAVEVIMNPPARYESEGGPILNIVSSKSEVKGYKGSITTRGTYGIFAKHYFGTSHFFKSKKLDVLFNYGYNPLKKTKQNDNFINYRTPSGSLDRWNQDLEIKDWTQAHNANLILDYRLAENHTLGLTAIGLFSPDEFKFGRSLTAVTSTLNVPFTIQTGYGIDSERSNVSLDANYTYDFEKGSLSVNGHYTNYNRDVDQRLSSSYRDTNQQIFRTVRFNSEATQDIDIYTSQIDYQTQLGTIDFELGGKYSAIDSRSKIDFNNIVNNVQNGLSQAQNDDFLYDEDVFAGYISLAKEWDKWSWKSGLRVEQTDSKGTSLVLNEVVDLSYLEWFPSSYVKYEPSDKISFSLDYGRKLARPRYQDLNPFSTFLNENNFIIGNSGLLPSFSNNFNLNITLKQKYYFDFYFRDNGENILILPFQDNTLQVLRTERQNAIDSKSWGIDFTHGTSIKKWWYFYTYLSAFHEEETFVAVESNNEIVTNAIDGVYVSARNYLTLSKDKTWKAEASLVYLSKFLVGSYVTDPTTNVTLGISKSMFKDRGLLTITGNDILGEATSLISSRYLNQDNAYFPIPELQNLQVSFTYKFGNFKLDDNNRSIDKEERDRISSDN